jgi:hypothetical protein
MIAIYFDEKWRPDIHNIHRIYGNPESWKYKGFEIYESVDEKKTVALVMNIEGLEVLWFQSYSDAYDYVNQECLLIEYNDNLFVNITGGLEAVIVE